MTKRQMIDKLNDISSRINDYEDESVSSLKRYMTKLQNDLDEIIVDVEDNGLEEESPMDEN